jgi:hypothetical protein
MFIYLPSCGSPNEPRRIFTVFSVLFSTNVPVASVNSDEANIRYDLKKKSTHKDLGREYRLKNSK